MDQYDYLANIDKVLPEMLQMGGYAETPTVMTVDLTPHGMAIDQLIADGYMVQDPRQKGVYRLTADGRAFIRRGGYKAKFDEEERLKSLAENQTMSVISTNRIQKKTFFVSLAAAFSAVIIAAIPLLRNDDTSKLIQRDIQLIQASIDSIAKYQFRAHEQHTDTIKGK